MNNRKELLEGIRGFGSYNLKSSNYFGADCDVTKYIKSRKARTPQYVMPEIPEYTQIEEEPVETVEAKSGGIYEDSETGELWLLDENFNQIMRVG